MNYYESYEEKFNQLTLSNDFMFVKVMKNEKLCKKLLEIILGIEIEKIEYVEGQKVIDLVAGSHGIRLDIYVKDGNNTIYNVEMQTTDTKNLPKRSRYYQGIMDLNLLNPGMDYKRLNQIYIIFICTFDVFGKGRHIYTFENRCLEDNRIQLEDEVKKVFINPYSDMDDINEEFANFLRYLISKTPIDDFTRQLDAEVVRAKQNIEWRREFVTLEMKIAEEREAALQKGIEQGKLKTLFSLVNDGILTLADAAKKADMDIEEFVAAAEKLN